MLHGITILACMLQALFDAGEAPHGAAALLALTVMAGEAAARLPEPGPLGSVQGSAWAGVRAALVPPGQPLAGILQLAALLQVWAASSCQTDNRQSLRWMKLMYSQCMTATHS